MTDEQRTATRGQATWIIGSVLLLAVVLGITVLPTFSPPRSKLIGLPAPADFSLPIMTNGNPGDRIRLSDLRGKVVVLDFWASWCAPCRAEAPIIDRVARRRNAKDVVVLGVATSGDDWARAVDFVKSQGIGYTTVFDANDHVSTSFRVQQLPTLVVLNRAGIVSAVRPRMVREEELDGLIDSALKETAGS